MKILAVSTAKRSPFLPDVPTLMESGIDVDADAWNGLIAPGGTPRPMIDKINKDVVEIIKQPAVRDKLAAQLMEVVGSSPEEFRARIDGEIARWAPVIKAANIKKHLVLRVSAWARPVERRHRTNGQSGHAALAAALFFTSLMSVKTMPGARSRV